MAAITNLEIRTESLQRDIDSLKNYLARVRRTGDSMKSGIDQLSTMWDGPAKTAFITQFSADYSALLEIENTIAKLIDDLETARQKYNDCESEVFSIVNSISI